MIQFRAATEVQGPWLGAWGGRWVLNWTGCLETGPVGQPCRGCPDKALSLDCSFVPVFCGLGFVFPLPSLDKLLCHPIGAGWDIPIPTFKYIV